MKYPLLMTAILTASFALAQTGHADPTVRKPVRHAKRGAAAPVGFRQDAPHMIEIKPGTWISSWGCVMDDGKGGLMSCSSSGDLN